MGIHLRPRCVRGYTTLMSSMSSMGSAWTAPRRSTMSSGSQGFVVGYASRSAGLTTVTNIRRLGAPMLGTHAQNRGGGHHLEPTIEEMCGYMKRGAFTIASHMTEWGEELLNYHRDEDYKVVPLRDDLISAVRYAFMMRRSGKPLEGCEPYG